MGGEKAKKGHVDKRAVTVGDRDPRESSKRLEEHSSVVVFLESIIYYKVNIVNFKLIFLFYSFFTENESTEFHSNFTNTVPFYLAKD